ncbi:MAG TPA: TetR/AcrR family transcriptional regulator [Candidatus Dormibacteraeota bacterium]|nr:TetR/AcrR family transcriptional regulator [Candidatus Dormibacteraeota bacterium]
MTAATSVKTYHHGHLRNAMLDAVAVVAREHGLNQVSLRAVARHVGVTHAAAVHHFGNKAGLLTAFATQGFVEMSETVLSSISAARAADGPAMLEAAGRGYFRFAVRDTERFEAMFQPHLLNADDAEFLAAREATYALLARAIARCRDEGFVPEHEADVVSAAAWSLVHGLAVLWISGRLGARTSEAEPDLLASRVLRLFVDTVLRRQ